MKIEINKRIKYLVKVGNIWKEIPEHEREMALNYVSRAFPDTITSRNLPVKEVHLTPDGDIALEIILNY